ncbi:hypothetical protein PMZ80_000119 [Knufia obscura]|uniref:BSD domain-containing protein n=1 Tax=Knufia obscura TaxID=1635080 RepID=A0ABR0S0F0_9EURO|nr:hypothetical protein PMZ80_000119 [Knufia obscura]
MDFAYDHIAERTYSNDRSSTTTPKPESSDTNSNSNTDPDASTTPTPIQSSSTSEPPRQNLQTEFQETFRAFSSSPWGAKLGGWWSTAQKQGSAYYETARREAEKREAEAARVLGDAGRLVSERVGVVVEGVEERLDGLVNEERRAEMQAQAQAQAETEARRRKEQEQEETEPEVITREPETGQQANEDTETFLARFKSEATKRFKEVQKAEDAADDALLRFGSNIRNFLKDTISISAPEPSSSSKSSEVLFESKDALTGKRVIHTSRFDAQLHVIHTSPASFTQDPDGSEREWEKFKNEFDVGSQTERIAGDLEKYAELRGVMERLVPERVEYGDFWTRYYFLRHVVQVREERRREMLRASADQPDEEVAWDEDSDSEVDHKQTQKEHEAVAVAASEVTATPIPAQPGTTMATSHTRTDSDAMTLRPARRSHDEKSVADSEASYDLVSASGAASHANSSPKEKMIKEEESDNDWE